MGLSHPEQPLRITAIDNALTQAGLYKIITKYEAPLVTYEQLLRAHDPKYIDYIFNLSPKKGLVFIDPDTAMNPFTLTAAQRAAGALVYAVDLVMNNQATAVFCNIRPPGHHAEKSRAMGFCFFNNIAIGVLHALNHYHLKRVAIVDFDVHHGNGTEDILKNDERVLFCSSFEHPFYPFAGANTKSNHIINIPLHAGTSGKEFREKVTQQWLPHIEEFRPEIIFFSAGFDAYREDFLADLLLDEEDYAWITQQVKIIADKVCQGRMISTLEGGYNLEGLGSCAVAHVKNLL
jgi:acetoin utilization deacetylase AcuC-like enzyme